MKKQTLIFSLLCLTSTLAKAEEPLAPEIQSPIQPIELQFEPPVRNTFFQINPLNLGIGGGVRYRSEGSLRGYGHSFHFTPGFSKDFWGIVSYKYSSLHYQDASPISNYKGIGFKIGMIAHHAPFADIQFIKGWQYASGPFKWGQLEINALPIVFGVIGATSLANGLGDGAALLTVSLATAFSFNLAF